MEFDVIISLIGSLITIEEAGRGWIYNIRSFLRKSNQKKIIELKQWDDPNPVVQRLMDGFKSNMRSAYLEHEFTKGEIEDIVDSILRQDKFRGISYEDGKKVRKYIFEILEKYNQYTKLQMSTGEKVISDKVDKVEQGLQEINNHLDNVERNAAFRKLTLEVDECKNIGLDNIVTLINGEYEIDRSLEVEYISQHTGRFLSIQGHAGYGKSALAKLYLSDKKYVLYVRADRLAQVKVLGDIWNCDLNEAVACLTEKEILYIFVDALEYIADCEGTSGFEMLEKLFYFTSKHSNVIIITTCRTEDINAFFRIFSKYDVFSFSLNGLSDSSILKIGKQYSIISKLYNKEEYRSLLESPFYINLIVSHISNEDNLQNEETLREYIWDKVICLSEKAKNYGVKSNDIADAVIKITLKRAKEFVVGVSKEEIDQVILEALISENVLSLENNSIRLKYDIYEDICFEQIIDKYYVSSKANFKQFYSNIESLGRCIYRRYQIWISNKLLSEKLYEKLFYDLIFEGGVNRNWTTQTLIGIIKSDYCERYLERYFDDFINKKRLDEIIHITNLYGFQAKNSVPTQTFDMLEAIPIGKSRGILIRLMSMEIEKVRNVLNADEIITICDDYSKQVFDSLYDTEKKKAERKAVCTLLGGGCENCNSIEDISRASKIMHIRYRLADVDEGWISDFFTKLRESYGDGSRSRKKWATKVIDETLRAPDNMLVKLYTTDLCALANLFWKNDSKIQNYSFDFESYDGARSYGLSENADYHSYNTGLMDYGFIWKVLSIDYNTGLQWCIDFINSAIESYAHSSNNDIETVRVYFAGENCVREYYGSVRLWLASSQEQTIPTIISDILYVLKMFLIIDIQREVNQGNKSYDRLDYTRKKIYEESNNIAFLSLIEAIGMHFLEELPGYAIDLSASLELLYLDYRRHALYKSSPLQDMLKKQILQAVNIPSLGKERYPLDSKSNMGLQEYVIRTQILHEKVKSQCNAICDYLYRTIEDLVCDDDVKKQHVLQVEKMDIRKYDITEVEDGIIAVHGKKEDDSQEVRKEDDSLTESVNQLNDDYKKAKDIPQLLQNENIDIRKREKLCNYWIDGIKQFLNDGSFLNDNSKVNVLFDQLEYGICNELKNEILAVMLEYITYSGNNGIANGIRDRIKAYLKQKPELARRFFFALIECAKQGNKSKEQIISDYLVEGNVIDLSDFVLDSCNLIALCFVCGSGLDLDDKDFEKIIRFVMKNYRKLRQCDERSRHQDYFSAELEIQQFMQAELLRDNAVVDLLIDCINNMHNPEGYYPNELCFYNDIFSYLSVAYFDSYSKREDRIRIENRLGYIAEKFAMIDNKHIEEELYKALILTMPRYSGDWTHIPASYSHEDKIFLNRQFILYGKYHPIEMLNTIYNYHIDKLLPEILPSISVTLMEMSDECEMIVKNNTNVSLILTGIISTSFLQNSEAIKKDDEYTGAFENILTKMINWEIPTAAVVLDEFRLH